jgi:hypothetical protein
MACSERNGNATLSVARPFPTSWPPRTARAEASAARSVGRSLTRCPGKHVLRNDRIAHLSVSVEWAAASIARCGAALAPALLVRIAGGA